LVASCIAIVILGSLSGGEATRPTAKQALQPFNDLIGSWRGTGAPVGSREEQQKNFWIETMNWSWQFKGDDAWLTVAFDKGKYFTKGELRHAPGKDEFVLNLVTTKNEKLAFTGTLKNKSLTLDREGEKETQRLVFTFLHSNRFLYRAESRPEGKTLFTKLYSVGATKEGVPFAGGDGRPECIITGGLGTMSVSYQGKTYYVCCTGCRDEFNENPAKYVKEYEAKKAKKEK
jgi:hypothetical protein